MRFELTVALKYLIPKWRQLSVSIISLISILVISLVVWLVVLFLSVTEGIEKKWIDELVALNAHVRMAPTEAYYQSYFYQIDLLSQEANFSSKTLGEKLAATRSDPYDPAIDRELPPDFPQPDLESNGALKDPVKEGFAAIHSLPYPGLRAQEYEVGFGNLRLQLLREGETAGEKIQTFLTQVSYVASHEGENARVNKMILPPSAEDYNNLLSALLQSGRLGFEENMLSSPVNGSMEQTKKFLRDFFQSTQIQELKTTNGFILTPSLFPKEGSLKGVGVVRQGKITQAHIPQKLDSLSLLKGKLENAGYQTTPVEIQFHEGEAKLATENNFTPLAHFKIVLEENIPFKAKILESSLQAADTLTSLVFHVEGKVQRIPLSGNTFYKNLEIASASPQPKNKERVPFWVYNGSSQDCSIPSHRDAPLGEGLLIAKYFKNNGVCIGDRGYLAYYAQAGSSTQEQRIPVYVAGFYDPGMIPVGNKLIFVNPEITAALRGNTIVADSMLGNGINIWLPRLHDAEKFKEDLIQALEKRGIKKYWSVQSYQDYEFTRPILEQLRSDKNLFTLIAVIILIVACSNIISMLILLVNDKKKEIGILQSMGASPKRIAFIFGICGCVTGLLSCILGVAAAVLTLKNLQSLVDLLSFLQGREAFQSAFYGSSLPNSLSFSALSLVLVATLLISLLAGVIPAVKASKIRPTEILRSEG